MGLLRKRLLALLRGRQVSVLAAYYLLVRPLSIGATERVGPWGPRWLARIASLLLTRLLGKVGRVPLRSVSYVDRDAIDPCKQHLVVWHPHGPFTTMAFMHCGRLSATGEPLTFYPGIAPFLFDVPVFRELALLLNARSVDARVISSLAQAGMHVGIQPGGVPEQVQSDHTREVAVFPPRRGCVRTAMRHGARLLPVYIFGENQAYTTSDAGRQIAAATMRRLGVPLPVVQGRFGLPWLVPKPVDVHLCWGRPVDAGPPNAHPTDEEVEEVFVRYVAELRRVFDANAKRCLPADVAAKGLSIIDRRDGRGSEGVPVQALALRSRL